MRRLLILTYHFPPSSASGAFRMLGFARHLPRHGWSTVVVAPPGLPWEPDDPELLRQIPEDTVIFPVGYRQGWVAQRLAPFSVWLPRALTAARVAIHEHGPAAILTSGPPHQVHLLGWALSRAYKLPWVADFRDPWVVDGRPPTPAPTGPLGALKARSTARLERAVIERASAIVANAPLAGEAVATAYPAARPKVFTVCNGYDRETFDIAVPSETAAEPPPTLDIVHAGALYAGRDPRPFLDAVAALVSGPAPEGLPAAVRVLLLGPEPEDALDLKAEIGRRGLESVVRFRGQVPYAEAVKAMTRASVLLLFDSLGRRVGVPAKLYEYIGAGRPILALGESDGDLAWVLRESGAVHRLASPTDPSAIGRALAELIREPAPGCAQHTAENDDRRLQFTRDALAGRLAAILDSSTAAHLPHASTVPTPHGSALTMAR